MLRSKMLTHALEMQRVYQILIWETSQGFLGLKRLTWPALKLIESSGSRQ